MSNSTNENLLLIFIKNPEEGKVKTRLAESVGSEKALKVYHRLLEITKSVTDELNCIKQVWYSDFIDDEDLWPTDDYDKRLQKGVNLGERMKKSFKQAFESDHEKVIIVGSDCAELKSEIIAKAFRALDDNDVVIGPSLDGGYYLLGMSAFYPQLFDDKRWSTPDVLEQTLSQAENLGLSFTLLPELNDIDTVEDLQASDVKVVL